MCIIIAIIIIIIIIKKRSAMQCWERSIYTLSVQRHLPHDTYISKERRARSQSHSQKFLLRKEIYIEHKNILTAIHDQD